MTDFDVEHADMIPASVYIKRRKERSCKICIVKVFCASISLLVVVLLCLFPQVFHVKSFEMVETILIPTSTHNDSFSDNDVKVFNLVDEVKNILNESDISYESDYTFLKVFVDIEHETSLIYWRVFECRNNAKNKTVFDIILKQKNFDLLNNILVECRCNENVIC